MGLYDNALEIFIEYQTFIKTLNVKRMISAGIVSQSAMTPFEVNIRITDATKSLSAIGSKKVPKFEISFLIRAK